MDQELVPDQDMPSDDSFGQAVRDEGDVADTIEVASVIELSEASGWVAADH